jgi:hypothetical protein
MPETMTCERLSFWCEKNSDHLGIVVLRTQVKFMLIISAGSSLVTFNRVSLAMPHSYGWSIAWPREATFLWMKSHVISRSDVSREHGKRHSYRYNLARDLRNTLHKGKVWREHRQNIPVDEVSRELEKRIHVIKELIWARVLPWSIILNY